MFVDIVRMVSGDYAEVAGTETFTVQRNAQHPTDLAKPRGARLVVASETEKGSQWAESRITAMTGGDPISARFMRGDFFTYVPQFTLLIAGNHKPGVQSVDAARWRAVGRLRRPGAIDEASEAYLEEQDDHGQWIARWCVEGRGGCRLKDLFESWRIFCVESGQRSVVTDRNLSAALQARGFRRTTSRGVARFSDLMLNDEGLQIVEGTRVAREERRAAEQAVLERNGSQVSVDRVDQDETEPPF